MGITHEWNVLTSTNEASSMSVFIMDVFALPKIIYFILDGICNSPEHKTTVEKLTKLHEDQKLTYVGPKDEFKKYVKTLAACSVAVTLAVSIGIGFEELASVKATAGVASYLQMINEAKLGVVTGVAAPNLSQLQEFLACVALILTVKTAGLFLLKIGLVLNHLVEEHVITDKEKEACEFMAGLKDAFDRGRAFKQEDLETPAFQHYRAHFESAMEKHPELATMFGDEFLGHIGAYAKPESLARTIRNFFVTVGSTFAKQVILPVTQMVWGVVELGYSILTSPISKNSRKWLTEAKFDPNGTKLAWRNFVLAISYIFPAFLAAGKTFANAIGGTVARIVMEAISMAVDVFAFAAVGWKGSKMFDNPILNFLSSPLRLIAAVFSAGVGSVSKVGLAAVSIAATLVEFAGKVVLAAFSALPVVLGAIAAGVVWVAGYGSDYPDGFRDKYLGPIMKGAQYIWKHGGKALSKGCNFIRDNCLNGTHAIDSMIYHGNNEGSSYKEYEDKQFKAGIQDAKDAAVANTLKGYETFKRALGLPLYWLRNLVIRTQEAGIQKSQISKTPGEVKEDWGFAEPAMRVVNENCKRVGAMMGYTEKQAATQPETQHISHSASTQDAAHLAAVSGLSNSSQNTGSLSASYSQKVKEEAPKDPSTLSDEELQALNKK